METRFTYIFCGSAFLALAVMPFVLFAQTPEQLRQEIEERNAQIRAIEQEIAQYEAELTSISQERRTLESAVRELDVSRQKITASANAAQARIGATELEIQELENEIAAKNASIEQGTDALAETIRRLNEAESRTLVESMLSANSLQNLWDDIDAVQQFQSVMGERVRQLTQIKRELEIAQEESEDKREILVDERSELVAQREALDINRQEKNELLAETQDEEANYQKLLAEKQAAKEAFERELQEFEAQLQYTLDPSRIPPAGAGVLAWPLSSVTITQHFGNTEFAQSGAYNGSGHNGVDFRASVGTPIKAALSGVVQGTGNTDAHPGCYSYGKWVLVRHNNGLATLYAHLSQIGVSSGQVVATGEIIGHSGNTGYSTGPHLHFTVYDSNAVQIVRLGDVKAVTNCPNASIPVAPLEAYLNPLDYL